MYSPDSKDACLKNFPNPERPLNPNDAPYSATLPEAMRNFRNALGYELKYLKAGAAQSADDAREELVENFVVGELGKKVYGNLRLARTKGVQPQVDWQRARAITEALASVLTENYKWREAAAQREAEIACLATVEPESESCEDELAPVAERLRDVMRSGARALGGFDAAALYMLNEDTTALRTAALWRLPDDRFLERPRSLQGARAEVEALLGSAVVLNDEELAEIWRAPEIFPCSVCIPIISDSAILGVLWFFANKSRKIGSRETEILDLVARRVVDELEKNDRRMALKPRVNRAEREFDDEELKKWVDDILGAND